MRLSNTTTCVLIESCLDPADGLPQQCKDIEDKIGDLIPWLIKLKDSVTTVNADGNHEEVMRQDQLIRCASHPLYFVDPTKPVVVPWKTSRDDLRTCWGRGRRPGSWIKRKILERSLSSLRTSGKRF